MLTLVPFAPLHFPILASWFASERDVVQWGGPSASLPLEDDQLTAMLDEGLRNPPTRSCWMVRNHDAFVGHAQLKLDWRNGNAAMNRIAVAPTARGRGLAAPMLSLVIADAFGRPEIERLELNVYSFNVPALRAYERLGFVKEGVRRASVRVGSDRWDTVIMALLRSEWAGHDRSGCSPR